VIAGLSPANADSLMWTAMASATVMVEVAGSSETFVVCIYTSARCDTQEITILIFTAVRTPNLTQMFIFYFKKFPKYRKEILSWDSIAGRYGLDDQWSEFESR
jgi:hypothetical protein